MQFACIYIFLNNRCIFPWQHFHKWPILIIARLPHLDKPQKGVGTVPIFTNVRTYVALVVVSFSQILFQNAHPPYVEKCTIVIQARFCIRMKQINVLKGWVSFQNEVGIWPEFGYLYGLLQGPSTRPYKYPNSDIYLEKYSTSKNICFKLLQYLVDNSVHYG